MIAHWPAAGPDAGSRCQRLAGGQIDAARIRCGAVCAVDAAFLRPARDLVQMVRTLKPFADIGQTERGIPAPCCAGMPDSLPESRYPLSPGARIQRGGQGFHIGEAVIRVGVQAFLDDALELAAQLRFVAAGETGLRLMRLMTSSMPVPSE